MTREAQMQLRVKESWNWRPWAYGIFVVAALIIFAVTYTTYAFSKYRGEVLPGTHIAQLDVSEMTPSQATVAVQASLTKMAYVPIVLRYPGFPDWHPNKAAMGLQYDIGLSVKRAMAVGRHETFVEQLLDRLPMHPNHQIPLVYRFDQKALLAAINLRISTEGFNHAGINAQLAMRSGHAVLVPAQTGRRLDLTATMRAVQAALGSLRPEVRQLPVVAINPVITDAYARTVQSRVEAFLAEPPVLEVGKHVVAMSRYDLAPMLSFHNQISAHRATIVMDVNPDVVSAYVQKLASQVDRAPQNARVVFTAGQVKQVSSRQTGRTLDQTTATSRLLKVVSNLKARARLHLKVAVTQPPVDISNPASLGINTLLGTGVTAFPGAGPRRLTDIIQISNQLTGRLISPGDTISFNTLVGTGWPDRVYNDHEVESGGQVVPSAGGAMQQVATTFLRALFAAGLQVVEHHSHPYMMSWYANPVGLDAVVSPANNEDLVFKNNTGHYLLLQTDVQPIRQEVYIYVYGPHLGWEVAIDGLGKVTKVYPHGPPVTKIDPSLAPGVTHQIAWAHDGADTVVQRTVTRPNGQVSVDQIASHYQPWQAVILAGKTTAPLPTSTTSPTVSPTGTPPPPTPAPSQTAGH